MKHASPAAWALCLLTVGGLTSVSGAESPPPAIAPFDAVKAREFQRRWAARIDRPAARTNSIGMPLVLLPPGEFTMGRTEEQFDELMVLAKKGISELVELQKLTVG